MHVRVRADVNAQDAQGAYVWLQPRAEPSQVSVKLSTDEAVCITVVPVLKK